MYGNKNEENVQPTTYQHQQIYLEVILQEASALTLRYNKI